MTYSLAPGLARGLDDIDLPLIGKQIGVGEDELHAVIDCESRGYGFDRQKRPIILFERHIFYRRLQGSERAAAVKAKLAVSKWSRATYNQDQYAILKRAMAINEQAALESCSWGMFQIMGFNHSLAGYANVYDMVDAFKDDEETHLQAAVEFIKRTGIDDDLRRHDWAGFARGYNGPGYKKNRYDEKLARAYAKWSRIKDTPIPDEVIAVVKDAAAEDRVSKTDLATIVLTAGGGLGTVNQVAQQVGDTKETLSGFLPGWAVLLILLAILGVGAYKLIERRRKKRDGRNVLAKIRGMTDV